MWEQFVGLVDGFKLITLAILIGADFILGVIVALKEGTFQFSKLADFLNTSVLTFVGGYFVVGFIALVEPTFVAIVTATWIALNAALLAMIGGKLKKLGIPIPNIVS